MILLCIHIIYISIISHIYIISHTYIYIFIIVYPMYCIGIDVRNFLKKEVLSWLQSESRVNSRPSVENFHRTEVWFDQQKNYDIPDHLNLKLESPTKSQTSNLASNCNWLVVSTPMTNINQLVSLFPVYGKINNVPNHQPGNIDIHTYYTKLKSLQWPLSSPPVPQHRMGGSASMVVFIDIPHQVMNDSISMHQWCRPPNNIHNQDYY